MLLMVDCASSLSGGCSQYPNVEEGTSPQHIGVRVPYVVGFVPFVPGQPEARTRPRAVGGGPGVDHGPCWRW